MPFPHPFPYQGSKRRIARQITRYIPEDTECLVEPFCGSGAVSIAALSESLCRCVWLNDLNSPLMELWKRILEKPLDLSREYEELWYAQHPDKKDFFFDIRKEFNSSHQPHHLLYLLARIVKGSVRYSSEGMFNQSPDNRRSGMNPAKLREQIISVALVLNGKTLITDQDFREVIPKAQVNDLIYLDPPYQGTSFTRDHRYYDGITFDEFVDALSFMNSRNLSYIVSYDGHTGGKSHGRKLPDRLFLAHLYIHAGRSTQSTLLGDNQQTVESLYLSEALVDRLNGVEENCIRDNQRDVSQGRFSYV